MLPDDTYALVRTAASKASLTHFHFVRIIKGYIRDRPVRHEHVRALLVPVDPLPCSGDLELGCGDFVCLQQDLIAKLDRNDQALMVDALAAEHAADGNRT